MNPLDLYLIRKAFAEFKQAHCFSIDTFITLLECGIDAEALEERFHEGLDPNEIEDFPITVMCTQEDVEELLDSAVGNNIERMIDIKTACDKLLEKE